MHGAWQKIVKVDLSSREIYTENIGEELYKNYLAGSGLAAYFLYQEKKYAIDPLGPENDILFILGLLTGMSIYTACKTSICAKSPLTGIWGESTFGGFWGAALKSAGYDGIWIMGISNSPVYLFVGPDGVEIRDAKDIWGLNTFDTNKKLIEETNPKAKVLCIGRAGEKLVKFSAIMSEGNSSRAAGRTGLGAVMGSKLLKGIAVVGKRKKVPLSDRSALSESLKNFLPIMKKKAVARTTFGTAAVVTTKATIGALPIKNYRLGISWTKEAEKISGQKIRDTIRKKDYGCFSCPIKCGKDVVIDSGPYAGLLAHGPEYETIAGFGPNLFNDNLNSIVTANFMCNDYGLDTISTSVTIAFAFEAFEKGLITRKDCDGLELKWGDSEVILEMVRKIGEREGIGNILAEGSRNAAEKIGKGSQAFLAHAKGLESSGVNPAETVSLALNWGTGNRGACHLESLSYAIEGGVPYHEIGYGGDVDGYTNEGKGRLVKIMNDFMATFNATGLCKFLFSTGLRQDLMAKWIRYTTGWEIDGEAVLEIGERIFNLKRAYNVKLGIVATDDIVSQRLMETLQRNGSLNENEGFYHQMLSDYYKERGWTENGIPEEATLKRLNLDFIKIFNDEN